MSDDSLPAPIAEARQILAHQRGYMARMLGGIGVSMVALMGVAIGNGSDLAVGVAVSAMMVWMFGHLAVMVRHADSWKRAHDTVKEWDRATLQGQLAEHLERRAPAEPEDPRWTAVGTLVGRIRELSEGDPHTAAVAGDAQARLRDLFTDLDTLQQAIDADAALGGDSPGATARAQRLQGALGRRSAQIERMVEAVRDLHAELAVRDSSADPLVDRLESLVAQVEAEAEVASVGAAPPVEESEDARRERVREAARRQSERLRE